MVERADAQRRDFLPFVGREDVWHTELKQQMTESQDHLIHVCIIDKAVPCTPVAAVDSSEVPWCVGG